MPYTYDDSRGWVGLQHHLVYRFSPSRQGDPQALSPFLANAGISISQGAPQGIEVEAVRFDSFIIGGLAVRDAALRWERDRPRAQNRCMFLLVSKGSLAVAGTGPRYIAPDGGVSILFPADTPIEIQIAGVAEFIIFSFDMDEVGSLVLSEDRVGDVTSKSSVYRAAYAYLHTLIRTADPDERETSSVLRSLTREMARALVTASFTSRQDRFGVYKNALAIIERRGREATLTPMAIAAELKVSSRTISRAFAEHDRSVARTISAHRANLALALISHDPSLSASSIAMSSGFANEQTLARAVKGAFGTSVGALRQAAGTRTRS